MNHTTQHTFHIPVMGIAFTIDTPVKVAKFGISSVLSLIEDDLIEKMRKVICTNENIPYVEITVMELDHRAKRMSTYLNLLKKVVEKQICILKNESFDTDFNINLYFELLPENSPAKLKYLNMLEAEGNERKILQSQLKKMIVPGSIDVNIMTKLDRTNYDKEGNELDAMYSDAHVALRGYANSNLKSSIVFSAGLNPRLFAYCEQFNGFFPDPKGEINKKIILKVSDFRSAHIQGKFLAKKGLWVSEFRIESGINCGGHAFISGGIPLGPILEEFKNKREELYEELYNECSNALKQSGRPALMSKPDFKITAQGGIGTSEENSFLLDYYNLDATGWGSPFLLVPEATNVDDDTLEKLACAHQSDYYLSDASPLGVPFNNFRYSSSEMQRLKRINKNKPGSPCYKKILSSNTEFTDKPICTASREYQNLKIQQLRNTITDKSLLKREIETIEEKDCLCEGLTAAAFLKNKTNLSHKLSAVTICPGPNLAYFSGVFSLKQMVDHIYGRTNILNVLPRPNVFVNELQLYADYLRKEVMKRFALITKKDKSNYIAFKNNLLNGIEYYYSRLSLITNNDNKGYKQMKCQLAELKEKLQSYNIESLMPCDSLTGLKV